MPELPEVETVRRSMAGRIIGAQIGAVAFRDFPGVVGEISPEQFTALVVGKRFERIDRRGKHLWLAFEGGDGLFVHLMMTGQLRIVPPDSDNVRFEHLRLTLSTGWDLAFADQRKFGRVRFLTDEAWAAKERALGPEPLKDDFTSEVLERQLSNRTAPIKAFLLDQRRVAGIGNIYADEALFRAGIHPVRPAGSLSPEEISRLHVALRTVLQEAIDHRGTTFSNYRDADGELGGNARNLRVYGLGDKATCERCGTPLQRLVVAGRGTHICPNCQPFPGADQRL